MRDLILEILKIARLFQAEQLEGYSKEKKDPDLIGGETSSQQREDAQKRKSDERGGPSGKTRERSDTKLNLRNKKDPDLKVELD